MGSAKAWELRRGQSAEACEAPLRRPGNFAGASLRSSAKLPCEAPFAKARARAGWTDALRVSRPSLFAWVAGIGGPHEHVPLARRAQLDLYEAAVLGEALLDVDERRVGD